MPTNDVRPGGTCYFIRYDQHRGLPGEDFNADNYEVVPATILSVTDTMAIVQTSRFGNLPCPINEVFRSEEQADSYRYKRIYDNLKDYVIRKLRDDDLPRDPVRPNFEPFFTCNPMRMTERNLMYGAQSNTWGEDINVQKIILLLVVTVEDLKMLAGILELVPFVNDYAKKLIGKFMVVELNNLFVLINGSEEVKGLKDFNGDYAKTEFEQLIRKIRELEAAHEFKSLRDKIAAHKDARLDVSRYLQHLENITKETITEYSNLLIDHIGRIIAKYYPTEARLYFPLSRMKFTDILSVENSNESYKPFDSFKM